MSSSTRTPQADSTAGSREIVVYTRPGCPYCFTLRAGLRWSGLTFREIDIWENPAAAAFVRSVANGNETVPTVTVGGISMVNPSTRRVRSFAAEPGGIKDAKHRRWLRRPDQSAEAT